MIKRLGFIALLAVTATVGSISAQVTNTINEKSDIKHRVTVDAGYLPTNGYYNVDLTLYHRNVTGILWATKVKWHPKKTYLTGRIKNFDGTYDYSRAFVNCNDGSYVTWYDRPTLKATLSYLPTNARDHDQRCGMKFVGSVYSSRNNGNLVTVYGGFGLEPPYNTQHWLFSAYESIMDGSVQGFGDQNWLIP